MAQNRGVDHWNKIQEPNMGTYNYSHLILEIKTALNIYCIHWRKCWKSIFNKDPEKTPCPYAEEWNYTHICHPTQKLSQVDQRHHFENWSAKTARLKHG